MIEGYTTVKDIASKWGITVRTVQIMCAEGKIEGVTKFGNVWAIPVDAEKPTDNRVISGEYKNWRRKNSNEVKENGTEV
ncbi:MAG: DNA-binding protein [Clostridia bacterium]|nr:DNA-binding protein [Clostridia bacterium]